jgi:hypothetical protein
MVKAARAPLAEEWRGTWSPGWTSIAALPPGAGPSAQTRARYLTYYSGNGAMQIGRIREPERGPDQAWELERDPDWTTVVPFRANGRAYYLGYSSHMGRARIERVDGRARTITSVWRANWGAGWILVSPFRLGGRQHFLVYRPSDGSATIDELDARADRLYTVWDNPGDYWETGWVSVTTFTVDGWPHFLAYRNRDGIAAVGRFNPNGQGATVIWDNAAERWERGWAWFARFERGGQTYLLKYRMSDGAMALDRVRPLGLGVETRWDGAWAPGLTSLAPFTLGGAQYLLSYDRATGAVAIHRFTW